MEIKVGDKVRVSKDAPELYTMYGETDWESVESTVGKIDGDAAEIKYLQDNSDEFHYIIIPIKYLIKVNDERKEPKFKVGDKVQVKQGLGKFEIATIVYYNSKDNSYRVEFVNEDAVGCLWYAESYLDPYTKPTAPTIKVGDLVEVSHNMPLGGVTGIIDKIDGDNAYLEIDEHISISMPLELLTTVQTREQMEACANGTADSCDIPNVNNHDFGAIKIPVEVDIRDGYWDVYTADLAREIAVKCAGRDVRTPNELGEYAVNVAKSVVEELKRK